MRDIVQHGTAALEPFKGSTAGHPDPSWVLQLSDETLTNSNLYAVQKMFDGKFQFDVFFESASANQKLSCSSSRFIIALTLLMAHHSRHTGRRNSCSGGEI